MAESKPTGTSNAPRQVKLDDFVRQFPLYDMHVGGKSISLLLSSYGFGQHNCFNCYPLDTSYGAEQCITVCKERFLGRRG